MHPCEFDEEFGGPTWDEIDNETSGQPQAALRGISSGVKAAEVHEKCLM